MADLTPQEMEFFASGGDISKLGITDAPAVEQGASPAPSAPAPAPGIDPIALAGLGNTPVVEPPAAPAPAPIQAPAPAPVEDPSVAIMRQRFEEGQRELGRLQAQLESLKQPPQTKEDPLPDVATDPLGNLLGQIGRLSKAVNELQNGFTTQSQQTQQQTAFQNFQRGVMELRDTFAKTTPDFNDAYQHLRAGRTADLKAFGMTDQEVRENLFREEVVLSEKAIQLGKNPAEVLYEMSKRHGYVPKTVPATAPATPAAKLNAVKNGLAGAPQVPAKSTPGTEAITVDSLREASDADLNALVSDPKAWAKIAGTDQHPI